MIYSFNGLRHNTVIRRNNKYGNICRLSASCSHCSKSFMSGSIKEGNIATVDFYFVSTYVLSNTACFSGCNICISDCVEKRCLTVVNVSHNNYDRASRLKVLFRLCFFFGKQLFFYGNNDFFLCCDSKFVRKQIRGIKVNNLICAHLIHTKSHSQKLFNNFTGCNFQLRSKIAYHNIFRKSYRTGKLLNRLNRSSGCTFLPFFRVIMSRRHNNIARSGFISVNSSADALLYLTG